MTDNFPTRSPRHQWKEISVTKDQCKRCGTYTYRHSNEPHAAFYCTPTPQWLQANPDDDRKLR